MFKDDIDHPDIPPDHESGLRRMMSDAEGGNYKSVPSLEDAKALPYYAIVLEGDYGGQIYATCPVSLIKCDEDALRNLLLDIDKTQWNDPDSANLFFEHIPVGTGVAGGMGGGIVTESLWLHPKVEALGVRKAIMAVLNGVQERIGDDNG